MRIESPIVRALVLTAFAAGCGGSTPELPSVRIEPAEPGTTDPLRLRWEGELSDPDGGEVTLEVRWAVNGVPRPEENDFLSILPESTATGETWEATVRPFNGEEYGDEQVASVVIGNSTPVIDLVGITPRSPDVTRELTASVDASDPDGDELTLSFAWTVDGAPNGTTGSTFPAGLASKGQVVGVTVTVTDGEASVEDSDSVTIVNAAPTATAVRIEPSASVTVDTPLTCVVSASDPDGDTITNDIEWTVDGEVIGSGETLSEGFLAEDTIRCRATPSDGERSGNTVTSAPVTVELRPGDCRRRDAEPADPYRGRSIGPDVLQIRSEFAYDAERNVVRSWCADDGQHPLAIHIDMFDTDATGADRQCGLTLLPPEGVRELTPEPFTFTDPSNGIRYTHYAFTIRNGRLIDRRVDEEGNVIGGCLARNFNRTHWGTDFSRVKNATWILGIGRDSSSYANNSRTVSSWSSQGVNGATLRSQGYLFGASNEVSPLIRPHALLVGIAYEAEGDAFFIARDDSDQPIRLFPDEAFDSDGVPVSGVYQVWWGLGWNATAWTE